MNLAQQRHDARNIPVTPAFGLEKKSTHVNGKSGSEVKDYFGDARTLKGSVISATFTIPHVLHKKGKSEWVSRFRQGGSKCNTHIV